MIHNLLEDTAVIYTCAMHSDIVSDRPGTCPKCGMPLVRKDELPTHAHVEGYDPHAGHMAGAFLRYFWISLLLTIPVVLYSDLFQTVFGFSLKAFRGSQYIAPVLASIVFFYGGIPFIVGAYREVRAKLPGMMTLVFLAIVNAYGFSIYSVVVGRGHVLFWELSTLITIMLLGHYLEMRSISNVQGSLAELAKLLPDKAELLKEGKIREVTPDELRVDDVVLIRPGGRIPADGVVIEGLSTVDESMVTGESKPVEKTVDNRVVAGTINKDGSLTVRVSHIGEGTFLAGIGRLIANAQASRSRMQVLADTAAMYLTYIAVIGGAVTFGAWYLSGSGVSFAIERLVAVLVVACPHALGLAVPLVVSISTTRAARGGIFVRDRLALEAARTIDVVLLDKTGTLTVGTYGVNRIFPVETAGVATLTQMGMERAEENVLRLAASVDARSEHAVSRALTDEAKKRGIELMPITKFERLAGKGVRGSTRGLSVAVGGEALLTDALAATIPDDIHKEIAFAAGKGQTIIYVVVDTAVVGVISLGDVIREESKFAIDALKRMGIKPIMLTGDSEAVAEWVAQELGIEEYFFNISPNRKVEKVKSLQERGLRVAMVGDGINDAPALAQATIGIAIGAGTNVAIESAGIILAKNDPRDIVAIINLSRRTYRKMMQNLVWAAGYNVIAIPVAAGVLLPFGIDISPAVSAAIMSLSTIIVALNALLLAKESI